MVTYARFTELGFVRTDCFGTSWAPSPTIFGCFIGLQNWSLSAVFVKDASALFVNGQSR